MVTPTMIWLHSFATCPLPAGPTKVGLPIVFKISFTLSNISLSPPTIIAKLADLAPSGPPEIGASRKFIFFSFKIL